MAKFFNLLTQYMILLIGVVHAANTRYMMYLTGQHNIVPEKPLVADITHVALAFMRPNIFNEKKPSSFPLFTIVEEVRPKFSKGTYIMVAIGGWGDTEGFEVAAASRSSRKLFAQNVKKMVDVTGADGVDIDWEYPGGNGEDYKIVPNSKKTWQIKAYPNLLAEIRSALGPDKIMSAAVPGLPRDMLAFTDSTIPAISSSLDFFNIMTYDLMNRRDDVTKHHTSLDASWSAIRIYNSRGVPYQKMNLGFAFYIKWFRTDPDGGCEVNPVGCKTTLMEDPKTGADLGQCGSFSWNDTVPEEVSASYYRARSNSMFDGEQGAQYHWDAEDNLWWTWDSPNSLWQKIPLIVKRDDLGGAFAWGLGEDADTFQSLRALNDAIKKHGKIDRGKELEFENKQTSSSQVEDEL